jgi:hypothetical protein
LRSVPVSKIKIANEDVRGKLYVNSFSLHIAFHTAETNGVRELAKMIYGDLNYTLEGKMQLSSVSNTEMSVKLETTCT